MWARRARAALPCLAWGPRYRPRHALRDALAGATHGLMVLPQGVAYALLAGQPARAGLVTALVPPLAFALLGASPHLVVGPTAVLSLLTAQTLAALAPRAPPAALLALLAGALQLALGALRLGVAADFLARAVVAGFTAGAALLIAASQLPAVLGLADVPAADLATVWQAAAAVASRVARGGASPWPAAIALAAVAALLLARLPRALRYLPAALILLVAGGLLSWLLDLRSRIGLAVVGDVAAGLPAPDWPWRGAALADVWDASRALLVLTFIAVVEAVSISRVLQARYRYRSDTSQDLVGLGAANIAGSFFGSFPATGSFSRTAVNAAAGAQSPLNNVVGAAIVLGALYLLMPVMQFLPKVLLAAVILAAVLPLLDPREILRLAYTHPPDGVVAVATMLATALLGTEIGVLSGIVLSYLLQQYAERSLPFAMRFDPAAADDDGVTWTLRPPSMLTYLTAPQLEAAVQGALQFRDAALAAAAATAADAVAVEEDAALLQNVAEDASFGRWLAVPDASILSDSNDPCFGWLLSDERAAAVRRMPFGRAHTFVLELSGVQRLDATAAETLAEASHQCLASGVSTRVAGVAVALLPTLRRAGVPLPSDSPSHEEGGIVASGSSVALEAVSEMLELEV